MPTLPRSTFDFTVLDETDGWLVVNKPMEGEVLVVVTEDHGLTTADLAGLAGVVLAVLLLVLPRGH